MFLTHLYTFLPWCLVLLGCIALLCTRCYLVVCKNALSAKVSPDQNIAENLYSAIETKMNRIAQLVLGCVILYIVILSFYVLGGDSNKIWMYWLGLAAVSVIGAFAYVMLQISYDTKRIRDHLLDM